MKKALILLTVYIFFLTGCAPREEPAKIATTTAPVYEFTARLCEGTLLSVTRLVTEDVSCLHDYSLNVRQAKAAEAAETVVISGAGLEDFMSDILADKSTIDASAGIDLLLSQAHHHKNEDSHDDHHHEADPHIWLSPANAMTMARNICRGLSQAYPQHQTAFEANLENLLTDLSGLQQYGNIHLETLSCRELITFHDGFAYLADAFGLTILDAIEEESGSEASARELIHMIEEVERHGLPAVFTEKSGSASAADIISRETGAREFSLDMAMAGGSYFDAMYHNIDTLKEALQ